MSVTKHEELMGYLAEWHADPHDECMTEGSWRINNTGHGSVGVPGRGVVNTHVLALQSVWPKPPGKVCTVSGEWVAEIQAAHGPCHNPACYNPQHLSWRTIRENSADRRRDNSIPDRKGSKHPLARLTEEQVLEIYDLAWHSSFLQQEIASQFGVTQSQVWNIKHGRKWAHLTGHVREVSKPQTFLSRN